MIRCNISYLSQHGTHTHMRAVIVDPITRPPTNSIPAMVTGTVLSSSFDSLWWPWSGLDQVAPVVPGQMKNR